MSKRGGNWEEEHKDHDRAPVRFLPLLVQEMGAQEERKPTHPAEHSGGTSDAGVGMCSPPPLPALLQQFVWSSHSPLSEGLINDHHVQAMHVCERGWGRVFLNVKTPTSCSLNMGCMISRRRRKMCWFPLELEHLLQSGQLIQVELRKTWTRVVSSFRMAFISGWPAKGPVSGEVLGTLWGIKPSLAASGWAASTPAAENITGFQWLIVDNP